MGGVVVDDQVDVQAGQGLAVDPVQETNELLVAMALHALADDLAVEHVDLVCLSQREGAEPLLIFLTADFSVPADQIRESEEEYLRKRPDGRFACGWLIWRQIPIVFRDYPEDDALQDLVKLCERLNLRFFDRMVRFESVPDISWRFQPSELRIDWLPGSLCTFDWRYRA